MRSTRSEVRVLCASASLVAALAYASAGAASPSSAGLPSGVYSGTIGGHEVVAELGPSFDVRFKPDGKSTFGGEYFYRDHGIGILLEGSRTADGSLLLREIATPANGTVANLNPSGDLWKVRVSGSALTGKWVSGNGHASYAISMTRAGDASKNVDPQSDDGDVFHGAVLRAPLTHGATQTLNGHTFTTHGDTRFGLKGFEILSAAPAAATAAANKTLAADFNRRRLEAFDCLTTGMYAAGGGEYTDVPRVAYFGTNVFTVYHEVGYFCGGAHPEAFVDPLTIDLRTGKTVDWKRGVVDFEGVGHAYADAIDPKIEKAGEDSPCMDQGAPMEPQSFAYAIVAGGLLVHGQFPHVAAVCEDETVLPPAIARPLLAPTVAALLPQ